MAVIQTFLGWLTLVADVLIVLTIISIIFWKHNNWAYFLRRRALPLIFIVSLASMLGSLYFSDILGYEPCKLCWYERIAMYPMVLISLVAIIKRDKPVVKYTFWLSIVGFLITLFHYILQTTGISILPCDAVGYSINCAKVFTLQFGYITIPIMALSAFAIIIILSLLEMKR